MATSSHTRHIVQDRNLRSLMNPVFKICPEHPTNIGKEILFLKEFIWGERMEPLNCRDDKMILEAKVSAAKLPVTLSTVLLFVVVFLNLSLSSM